MLVDVQQNPFEKHRVAIAAECYMEALALEGLPQDMTDELQLPDQPVNQQGSSAFVLHNLSDKPYRSTHSSLAATDKCSALSASRRYNTIAAIQDTQTLLCSISCLLLSMHVAVIAMKFAKVQMLYLPKLAPVKKQCQATI